MSRARDGARFARVIASDLVAYYRAPDSPLAGSEASAREFAAHGLYLLRTRFGDDLALERYYADCIASVFQSLRLAPLAPGALGTAARPFVERALPDEQIAIVFGASRA